MKPLPDESSREMFEILTRTIDKLPEHGPEFQSPRAIQAVNLLALEFEVPLDYAHAIGALSTSLVSDILINARVGRTELSEREIIQRVRSDVKMYVATCCAVGRLGNIPYTKGRRVMKEAIKQSLDWLASIE